MATKKEHVADELVQTIPKPNVSSIKNKKLRTEAYRKLKRETRKVCRIIT